MGWPTATIPTIGMLRKPKSSRSAWRQSRRLRRSRRPSARRRKRKDGRAALAENSGQVQSIRLRASDGVIIAGVRMAHNTARWVVPEHTLNPSRGVRRAVSHNDHAGMLRKANAHAAAVMERYPGRA